MQNRRMLRRRVSGFAVGFVDGIIIHMIAEQIAQRDRVGVIMINAGVLLMRIAGIERRAFVHIGVAVPIAGDVILIGVRLPSQV